MAMHLSQEKALSVLPGQSLSAATLDRSDHQEATSSIRTLWIRASRLSEIFCSGDLAYRCVKSGWLKPIIQGKRRTIYRIVDVLTCMHRIENGELPPGRPAKASESKSGKHRKLKGD
jgi:hypothetical protein